MKRIISFFIHNQLLVNVLIIVIILFGVLAATRMNSSFFPELAERFIIIEATYPGSSPQEIEEGIVFKVEENLKSVTGIDRVTSVSNENIGTVTIELYYGTNADQVLQDVKNAVDQISTFPDGLERLVVYIRENENFTAKVAITGEVPLKVLKERAEFFEENLRRLPNLSRISLSGFTEEEIEVALRDEKMRAYQISYAEVSQAIASENIQVTGGRIRGRNEVIIRADQKEYHADQLLDLVVRSLPDGNVIRLKEIATITDGWSEGTNASFYNDKQAVMITVNTLNQENILDAAASIRNYIETFNAENTVIKAIMVDDGTTSLRDRIGLLIDNGALGGLIVFVILGFFLRIRLAFWVAIGIPISFLGMFILANIAGITINVLSLFGMILVIGILVDDGIVIGENIYQHYERGSSRLKAVIEGTMEVLPSVFSAIATTCTAFSLFFFLDGQLGEFYKDVSFVVICALGFSLIEVLLFLPAHLAHVKDLTEEAKPNKLKSAIENLIIKYRDQVFKPVLQYAIRYKLFAGALCLALLISTIAAIANGVITSTFFPNIEQTQVTVSLEYPPGTSEEITHAKMDEIKLAALSLNDFYKDSLNQNIITDTEISLGTGSNIGKAIFYLVASEKRAIRSFTIASDLRKRVGPVPRATKLSYTTQSAFGKPLNASFSGPDYERLRSAANDFKQQVSQTGMVKDLVSNDQVDQPEIDITLNNAGRGLGFSTLDIIQQIRYRFFGVESQQLQRGDDEVKVWVRSAMDYRDNLRDLEAFRVTVPGSEEEVTLKEVADLKPVMGQVAINHLDGIRQISVEGEMASTDVTSTEMIQKVRSDIFPEIRKRYPNIDVSMQGQQRETRKLQKSLSKTAPVVLTIMVVILIITFRSVFQTVALLLTIPFGLIGAGWGHFIHGHPMSLLSLLGFIALIGVLINDGLVYVNTFNINLKKGMKFDKALIETSIMRFRPIFLTTVTTAAGLGPLIFEDSFQAQFLIPMAISIAYGLIAGSIFLTILLPILLALMNRLKVWRNWLWEGEKPEKEAVEAVIVRQKKYQDEKKD